jgi:hypothetical protein
MRKSTPMRPKGGNSHGYEAGHWKADPPGKPIPEPVGSGQAPGPEPVGLGKLRDRRTAANLEARKASLALRRF